MTDHKMDELVTILVDISSKEEMREFLLGLLTSKEREELASRVEIVKLLKQGIPQHTIAKQLNVGVATITRGSKELQKGRFSSINSI